MVVSYELYVYGDVIWLMIAGWFNYDTMVKYVQCMIWDEYIQWQLVNVICGC